MANHTQLMIGEKTVSELLAEAKKCSHAYIFEGEKGLCTGDAAVWFASALLCEKEDAPCGKCESCIQTSSGNNPDIIYLSLGSITSKKSIGTDDIRFVISDVYTKPFWYEKKVYIIGDGDALTPQAQNAMLKILEEPPFYAVFIICTANAELILPTVRSRSRIIHFRPASKEKIAAYVKEKYPEAAQWADFAASYADGSAEKADFLCRREVYTIRDRVVDEAARLLCKKDEKAIFELCDAFEEYKAAKGFEYDVVQAALDFMLSFVSDVIRIQNGCRNMIVNSDKKEILYQTAENISMEKSNDAAYYIMQTKQMILKYVSAKAAVMRLAVGMYYGRQ